ncbi:MAG TPA: TlpA disulfide reductase family protein, partial [Flavisolibacter sp.]|nr:TlpA disulfide reductase family protein [Flavisolibacter sp.]
ADYQRLEKVVQPVVARFKTATSPDQYTTISKEYAHAQLAFVRAHPTSWVSLEVLGQARQMGPPQYDEVAPLYAALTPAQRASPPGRLYGELLAGLKATALGELAPAFTQLTPSGQSVSLADYRGKYVLVDFWASWCQPCRQDNPNVVKAFHAFKDKNFTILGVSLDQNKDAWQKAIQQDGLAWTQVSDLKFWDNAAAVLYGVQGIPYNVLVDPNGNIIAENLHGEEIIQTLQKVIK